MSPKVPIELTMDPPDLQRELKWSSQNYRNKSELKKREVVQMEPQVIKVQTKNRSGLGNFSVQTR